MCESTKLSFNFIKKKHLWEICPQTESTLRIAYNNAPPVFYFEDSKPKIDTLEEVFISTFLEKHRLGVAWYHAGQTWGSRDSNGSWNGVVGMVGYFKCDVGISSIGYTQERGSFIDYSHPVGVDAMKWMSKPPQKLPPASNIIRIFDKTGWK